MSLTAVRQRFEDERYDEVGKEKVMSYSQLCSLLGVKQEDPKPSPLHTNVIEMKAFFSSPYFLERPPNAKSSELCCPVQVFLI